MNPLVFKIEFVCSRCGKTAKGEKRGYEHPQCPKGWLVITSSGGSCGPQPTKLVNGLFCPKCKGPALSDLQHAIGTTSQNTSGEVNVQLKTVVY